MISILDYSLDGMVTCGRLFAVLIPTNAKFERNTEANDKVNYFENYYMHQLTNSLQALENN